MRDERLDFVRCVSNYMIVFLHAWAAFQYVEQSGVEYFIWTVICTHFLWVAVPTLFMISGYLLFVRYNMSKYGSKVVRRIKRLAIPYITWNMVFVASYLLLALIIPSLSTRIASFGLDSLSGVLSKVLSFSALPIDGPLWYLRLIFLLALVSPVIWLIMIPFRGIMALGLCAAWCIAESMLGLTKQLQLLVPAYAILCFVLGGVLALHNKDLITVFKSRWWVIIGVCACVIKVLPPPLSSTPVNILITFMSIFEAPLLLSIVYRVDVKRITHSRIYAFFRDMSFFAYAGHKLICSIWLHIFAIVMGGFWVGKFTVLITIYVVFGITTMIAVYYGGRKLIPMAIKVLDGNL